MKDANCNSLCNKSGVCWVFLPIFHISKSYIFMQKEVCCDTLFFFANPDDEEQGVFFNEIKRANYGRIPDDKINFSKTIRFIFNGRLSNKIMSEKEIMRQKKLLKKYTAI